MRVCGGKCGFQWILSEFWMNFEWILSEFVFWTWIWSRFLIYYFYWKITLFFLQFCMCKKRPERLGCKSCVLDARKKKIIYHNSTLKAQGYVSTARAKNPVKWLWKFSPLLYRLPCVCIFYKSFCLWVSISSFWLECIREINYKKHEKSGVDGDFDLRKEEGRRKVRPGWVQKVSGFESGLKLILNFFRGFWKIVLNLPPKPENGENTEIWFKMTKIDLIPMFRSRKIKKTT